MSTDDAFFDPARASNRRSIALLALGALSGLAIAGYGLFTAKGSHAGGVPAQAVALVNQRQILRSDFMTQTIAQYAMPFAATTRAQRASTLHAMIDEELMMQRGLEIDLPSFDPAVRNALVAGVELEVTADVIAQQPTDAELRAYYEQHRDNYAADGVMRLRDLVAKTVASAQSAVVDLRAHQPLEGVLQQHGLVDSGRLSSNGKVDLGDIFDFAVRIKLDPTLYAAAATLRDGEVSEPIQQPDGVHVLVMLMHRSPVPLTFEQASNRIWSDVKKAAQAQASAANLAYLHSRADILVAPDYAE